jgi:TRAP-type C4-dicarboxylate transport system permease small subunit
MEKATQYLSKAITVVLIVLSVIMICTLTLQVFARYLFSKGFPWTDETARFCMIWAVYIGAAYIVFNGEHVKMSVFEDMMSKPSIKKALLSLQYALFLVFSVFISVFGFEALEIAALSKSQNLPITMSDVYVIIPISGILMAIGCAFRLLRILAFDEGGARKGADSA